MALLQIGYATLLIEGYFKFRSQSFKERKDEWMNEWMKGWKDEWMNEWMNEWMKGWMNEWMNEKMKGWMNEWMNWIPKAKVWKKIISHLRTLDLISRIEIDR